MHTRSSNITLPYVTVPAVRATPISRIAVGEHLSGNAATALHPAVVDLFGDPNTSVVAVLGANAKGGVIGPNGEFSIGVITQNGQGNTPTSPGTAATITIKWAVVTTALAAAADGPVALAAIASSLTCTLPDSNGTTVAGSARYSTGVLRATGRYLYIWAEHSTFTASAEVDLSVNIVSL